MSTVSNFHTNLALISQAVSAKKTFENNGHIYMSRDLKKKTALMTYKAFMFKTLEKSKKFARPNTYSP